MLDGPTVWKLLITGKPSAPANDSESGKASGPPSVELVRSLKLERISLHETDEKMTARKRIIPQILFISQNYINF